MVNVSHETAAETDARLRRVVKAARLKIYPGAYVFEEFPIADFPTRVRADALALVRDDAVWSQLVPGPGPGEQFCLFRFHFPENADNSGFVGWLATRLKATFGTGVFVTCGFNSEDGGVFDYWGVPAALGTQIQDYVSKLIAA